MSYSHVKQIATPPRPTRQTSHVATGLKLPSLPRTTLLSSLPDETSNVLKHTDAFNLFMERVER